jgi:hypothetical protein
MNSSWLTQTGHLALRWSEVGSRTPYRPHWMQETPAIPGDLLLPVPDFASKSPFGGASWYQPWSPAGPPPRDQRA